MKLLTAFIIMETLAFIAVLVLLPYRKKEKAIERTFGGRQSHSDDEFHEQYFQQEGIPRHVVTGVKRILEEHLKADLSRLEDRDDFSTNLAFFWELDSMADVEIVTALEKEFNIIIEDAEAEKISTIREIIELVWRKLKNKPDV